MTGLVIDQRYTKKLEYYSYTGSHNRGVFKSSIRSKLIPSAIIDSRYQFDYLLILPNNKQYRFSILIKILLNSSYLSLLKQLTIISLKCLFFKVPQEPISAGSPIGANTVTAEYREQREGRKEVIYKYRKRVFLVQKIKSKSQDSYSSDGKLRVIIERIFGFQSSCHVIDQSVKTPN